MKSWIVPFSFLILHSLQSFSQQVDWVHRTGSSGNDWAGKSVLQPAGCILTAGGFSGVADFDPDTGTVMLNANAGNMFVMLKDTTGTLLWVRQFGTTYPVNTIGELTSDSLGYIYICGGFEGSGDFDPGPGTFLLSSASTNAFVMKLDPGGLFCWAVSIGGNDYDVGMAVIPDDEGAVHAAGYFNQSADLDPGQGSYLVSSAGNCDGFLVKLDTAGQFIRGGTIGGTSVDNILKLLSDRSGYLYAACCTWDTADIDPGPDTLWMPSLGNGDNYLIKLTREGNLCWARHTGGTGWEQPIDLDFNADSNLMIVSRFSASLDLDPGPDTLIAQVSSSNGIFIQQMDTAGNLLKATFWPSGGDMEILDMDCSPTGNIFLSGSFMNTLDFDPGNSELNLVSFGQSDAFLLVLDSNLCFHWVDRFGGPLSDAGAALAVDSSGRCYLFGHFAGTADFNPGLGTLFLSAIGNYDHFFLKTGSCSSSDTALTVISCGILAINGQSIDSSGLYMQELQTQAGCDSVIELNVTVIHVDTAVIYNGNTLIATAFPANYQWLNCDSSYADIPGETQISFTPGVSGHYSVRIEQEGCVDTSSCYQVILVGIPTGIIFDGFIVFPNPATHQIFVNSRQGFNEASIQITDISGRIVHELPHQQGKQITIDLPGLHPGIYHIRITETGNNGLLRVELNPAFAG